MNLPILYSFRRCPYAIRARMALASAQLDYELREVLLKNKPAAMLALSAKGTVPVLQLADRVLDESIDVMLWALQHNDPDQLLQDDGVSSLVERNDDYFKYWLDRYKYFERFEEHPRGYYLQQAMVFLEELEQRLQEQEFLCGTRPRWQDLAIFPFIRQFAFSDIHAFEQFPLPNLQGWLSAWLQSGLFKQVMPKYPVWNGEQSGVEVRYEPGGQTLLMLPSRTVETAG